MFTLVFGGSTAQQTVSVNVAAPGLTAVSGARQSGTISIQVTGFDNTRTSGKLTFTFYDAAGNPVSPGAITVDSSSTFTSYFAGSQLGGTFYLTAVFPVTGDTAQIAAFEFAIANSAGTANSPRTRF